IGSLDRNERAVILTDYLPEEVHDHPACDFVLTFGISEAPTMRGQAGSKTEMVPVLDRIQSQREAALRFPSPERSDSKHHHVPRTDWRIDHSAFTGELVSMGEEPGHKQ